jgi:hypothetical protein
MIKIPVFLARVFGKAYLTVSRLWVLRLRHTGVLSPFIAFLLIILLASRTPGNCSALYARTVNHPALTRMSTQAWLSNVSFQAAP